MKVSAVLQEACFNMALMKKWPLYLSTKNTILKKYDGRFKDIFQEIYENEFKEKFEEADITYEHRLIDDMVASALKWNGNFVWACKNYDGDVQSDTVAQGFGSLGFDDISIGYSGWKNNGSRSSTWNCYKTLPRTSERKSNINQSHCIIFAWTRGLAFRGKLDNNQELIDFCNTLEEVCIETVESGKMTKILPSPLNKVEHGKDYLYTEEFLDAIDENLKKKLK